METTNLLTKIVRKRMPIFSRFFMLLLAAGLLWACESKDGVKGDDVAPDSGDYPEEVGGDYDPSSDGEISWGDEGGGSGSGDEQSHAGRVTAGEWRDLDNWLFWSNLMTNTQADQNGGDFTGYSDMWRFYTNHRVAVRASDGNGVPQRDVRVKLVSGSTVLYEARTDNRGETNLWIGLTQKQATVDESSLALVVDGTELDVPVSVTGWGEEVKWNAVTCSSSAASNKNIDIAFIVDATGSMMDEIDFLKADLTNIITTVGGRHADAAIRTAAVFYRDEGDDYLTRESDFTNDLGVTVSFIEDQFAEGGGDYPEAVHTALEAGLQKLSWREGNSIRLAFMLLDAPPHLNEDVLSSLHRSVPMYAKNGIRIIPVAASGVDKPTEFFLRFAAISTDATYVFLTNDSGIGGEHIAATVGDYQVELLNELIVRLIEQYLE